MGDLTSDKIISAYALCMYTDKIIDSSLLKCHHRYNPSENHKGAVQRDGYNLWCCGTYIESLNTCLMLLSKGTVFTVS